MKDLTLIQRRSFLKMAFGAAFAASTAGPLLLGARRAFAAGSEDFSPIAALPAGTGGSRDYNGDDFDRAHEILWDKDNYLRSRGGVPVPEETVDVVVIGGGMAGLTAAYRLKDRRAVVLESARRLGGNAKGERWGDAEYSIGAAYLTKPDDGDEAYELLKELGLASKLREESGEESTVQLGGKLVPDFWNGATDPARADEFRRAWKVFENVRENAYPDIPFEAESQLSRAQLHALDALTFEQWVRRELGTVHPHLEELIREYCWSSFAAEWDELSAAQGLSFFASDLGGTVALPGGNSAIARALVERLVRRNGADSLRTGMIVIDVRADADGVTVAYEDSERRLRSLRARHCIFAAPKMLARKLITGIPAAQDAAMGEIRYRAYLVANLLLNERVKSPSYELFRLEGRVPQYPIGHLNESPKRPWTDLCFGTWAAHDAPSRSVLTIYKALPWEGARQFLFSPFSHDRHRDLIDGELPSLLGALGVRESAVAGVRMTRWGHAIPVARTGMLSSGVLERARAPIAGRIHFCGQDNWANACSETAIITAGEAVRAIS